MGGIVAKVTFVDIERAFAVQFVQHVAIAACHRADGAKPLPTAKRAVCDLPAGAIEADGHNVFARHTRWTKHLRT